MTSVAKFDAHGGILKNVAGNFTDFELQNVEEIENLCSSVRLTAGAIRILPKVELVTDTTQTYISYAIGGMLTASEIYNAALNNINIEPMLRASPCAEIFGNQEGCSVRYDPFQTVSQLEMVPNNWLDSDSKPFDNIRMPCIYVVFSQDVPSGDAYPFLLHGRMWFEGILQQPTPIYASESPVDLAFDEVRGIMSQCRSEFPIVVSGHSFIPFLMNLPAFVDLAAAAISSGSKLWQTLRGGSQRKTPSKKPRPKTKTKKKKQAPKLAGGPRQKLVRPTRNTPSRRRKR
jgi:hypothetical protein